MVQPKIKMIIGVCAVVTILVITKLSITDNSFQNLEIQPLSDNQEVTYPVVQAQVKQDNQSYTRVEETIVHTSSN